MGGLPVTLPEGKLLDEVYSETLRPLLDQIKQEVLDSFRKPRLNLVQDLPDDLLSEVYRYRSTPTRVGTSFRGRIGAPCRKWGAVTTMPGARWSTRPGYLNGRCPPVNGWRKPGRQPFNGRRRKSERLPVRDKTLAEICGARTGRATRPRTVQLRHSAWCARSWRSTPLLLADPPAGHRVGLTQPGFSFPARGTHLPKEGSPALFFVC